MKKIDLLKSWATQKRLFSTTDVKRFGLENFYTSAEVRVRIDFILDGFVRAIPDDEARKRNLVKEGNRNIRWYQVIEQVKFVERPVGKEIQYCLV